MSVASVRQLLGIDVSALVRPGVPASRGSRHHDALALFAIISLAALLSTGAASWLLSGDVGLLDSRLLIGTRHLAMARGPIGVAARELMLSATALGAFATLALVILAAAGFLVSVDRRAAALGLIAQASFGMLLTDLLKHLVDRPRPAVVAHWAHVTSSSFPSGHSADSAIAYFLLAALANDHLGASRAGTYVRRVSIALVLLVGTSRVYLGVHYPTDVFAGWAFGAAWIWFWQRVSTRDAVARVLRARTFHDVIVHPTQQLLRPPFLLFRGGPDWPLFWVRREERHCRFAIGIPLDIRPRRAAERVIDREAQGVWCGPVIGHFGHAVTTFGSRIAGSSLLPPYVPLVFSARPGDQPPPFLWQMLAHFGVPPERVRIVSAPVIFDTLSVLPQAERLFGGAPSPAYLDLLDKLSGPAPGVDGSKVYVSRAGMWKGKLAGEAYLETVLERCGFQVFRPEDFPLEHQLATYRRASQLVFAEGSALHCLQLLGRIDAEVTVIVRRNGTRLARSAIHARVRSLSYVDAVRGLVHGVGSSGRPQPSAGVTVVDTNLLVAELERRGISIRRWWNEAEFRNQQSQDLGIWIMARSEHPPHHRDRTSIERSLRRLGLSQRTRTEVR